MIESPSPWLPIGLALFVGIAVPLYAWAARGRVYAAFSAVMLAISLPPAVTLGIRLDSLAATQGLSGIGWLFVYALGAAGLHLLLLVRARLRGAFYRYAISTPGQVYVALGALCFPYVLVVLPLDGLFRWTGAEAAASVLAWVDLLPVLVVLVSLATSMRLRREIVRIELGGEEPDEVSRLPVQRHRHRRKPPPPPARRPLRIVQITDPHVGPWQPVHRLERLLDRLLRHEPDLVLLTGDFLTMEGNGTPGALEGALAPLRAVPGRCFAIFGNHDHEAPDEVRGALKANSVDLLVDEERVVETPVGAVQLVGSDYHRSDRAARIQTLLARYPRREGQLRLFMLHDPLGFHDVPRGDVDLTLSGHTHGGQVGLVSFGLDWTVLSRTRWPDHGLFGHGSSRLYVHRGTGFYGFPLRIGVPGEASLLELVPHEPEFTLRG